MNLEEELRALWRDQPTKTAPITRETLCRREAKLARLARLRNGIEYGASVFAAVLGIASAVVLKDPVLRGGTALMVITLVPWVLYVRWLGAPSEPPPPEAPTADHVAHYRAELQRQRAFIRRAAWCGAPPVAAALVFYAGAVRTVLGFGLSPRFVAILFSALGVPVLAIAVALIAVNVRAHRKIARELAALEP